MVSKEEYLADAEVKYYWMARADNLAKELEARIAEIRSMGYKIIVLGNTVKIT